MIKLYNFDELKPNRILQLAFKDFLPVLTLE